MEAVLTITFHPSSAMTLLLNEDRQLDIDEDAKDLITKTELRGHHVPEEDEMRTSFSLTFLCCRNSTSPVT
jgi:hypothetical protein